MKDIARHSKPDRRVARLDRECAGVTIVIDGGCAIERSSRRMRTRLNSARLARGCVRGEGRISRISAVNLRPRAAGREAAERGSPWRASAASEGGGKKSQVRSRETQLEPREEPRRGTGKILRPVIAQQRARAPTRKGRASDFGAPSETPSLVSRNPDERERDGRLPRRPRSIAIMFSGMNFEG